MQIRAEVILVERTDRKAYKSKLAQKTRNNWECLK